MPNEYSQYQDAAVMNRFFSSLEPIIQQELRKADVEITTLGELQLYAEHLRGSLGLHEKGLRE